MNRLTAEPTGGTGTEGRKRWNGRGQKLLMNLAVGLRGCGLLNLTAEEERGARVEKRLELCAVCVSVKHCSM